MNGSSDKLLVKYAMKNDKKEEIFHSSGYARSQSGANFGAAAGDTLNTRNDLNTHRKYVKSYKDSRLTNEYLGFERAKSMASSRSFESTGSTPGSTPDTAYATGASARNKDQKVANLTDNAYTRAKNAATGSLGRPSAGLRGQMPGAPRPSLGAAKAPSIPSRRPGI